MNSVAFSVQEDAEGDLLRDFDSMKTNKQKENNNNKISEAQINDIPQITMTSQVLQSSLFGRGKYTIYK